MGQEQEAKDKFEQRVKENKLNAIQENIENAKENNSSITQTINSNGELVGVKNMNTQEDKLLGANATIEDIKEELFGGENIVLDKNSDHGINDVLSNLKKAESKDKDNAIFFKSSILLLT